MMANTEPTGLSIGHPAPDRDRVSAGALAFALVAPGLAWSLQLSAGAALGRIACVGGDGAAPRFAGVAGLQVAVIPVNLVALAVAVAGLIVGWLAFSHTRVQSGGETEGLLDAGEGRSRFLAVWAIFAGVLFALSIAFNTIGVLWRGLCVG